MESRLGLRLLLRKPGAPALQAMGLSFGIVVAVLAISFVRLLNSDVALPGAQCAGNIGWLSANTSGGDWLDRFSPAQLRALRRSTDIPLIPVLGVGVDVYIQNTRVADHVVATDPALFSELCIDPGQGGVFNADAREAVVSARVGKVGQQMRVNASAFTIVAAGTRFKGLSPEENPSEIFISFTSLAQVGINPETIGMPTLRILVGKPRTGANADQALATALAENQSNFPGIVALRKLPGLGLAGDESDKLRRYGQLLEIVAAALLILALLDMAAYQIGRQPELSARMKILHELGASSLQLRRLAYVEPLMIALLSLVIGFAVASPADWLVVEMLDMPRLATKLQPAPIAYVIVSAVVGLIALGLAELRFTIGIRLLPRALRRITIRGFDYVIAIQTLGCVVSLGLAIAAVGAYVQARPSVVGYDLDHVRAYFVFPKPGEIPGDFAARVAPVLADLGSDLNGAAALSQSFLPVTTEYWASMVIHHDVNAVQGLSNYVTPGYFDVLHLKLLEGRPFSYDDTPRKDPSPKIRSGEAHVAIANWRAIQALRLQHTTGETVQVLSDASNTALATVRLVGLVDERTSGNDAPGKGSGLLPILYLPFLTPSDQRPYFQLLIRYDPKFREKEVDRAAERAIQRLVPGVATPRHALLRQLFDDATATERSVAYLFGTLALGALALTLSGIVGLGLLRANMERLTHAIHFAIGASRTKLTLQHMTRLAVPLGGGILLGSLLEYAALELLVDSQRFTSAEIILTVMATSLLMLVISCLAIWSSARPLRRADYSAWLKSE